MVVAAVAVGVAAVGSAVASNQKSQAAKGAANAAREANAANNNLSQSQYDQTREDYAPYREAGTAALGRLNAASTGDYSSFTASPDYQFTLSEGQRDLGNSFAARGGAFSGNALKALSQYNQGLASQQYGDWWNRQQGLVNTGATGTSGTAAAGAANVATQAASNTNAANAISNSLYEKADARASGVLGVTNALSFGLGNYSQYGSIIPKSRYN